MNRRIVARGEQPETRIYSAPRALRGDIPLSSSQSGAAR
jgi:hypothetical protein